MLRNQSSAISRGFTLIELMIVIAIVAILVALAVPAFKDYTIRAKVAECVNGAAVAKIGISEYRQSFGAWPPTLAEAGLTTAGISHYCAGFTNYEPDKGAFTIDVDEAAIDAALTADSIHPVMKPNERASGFIDWNCSRGTMAAADLKYVPSTCRDS